MHAEVPERLRRVSLVPVHLFLLHDGRVFMGLKSFVNSLQLNRTEQAFRHDP
jgi:hypothetical protein